MSNKKVPELRFNEFTKDWKEKKLGVLFSNARTKGNSSMPIYSVSQKVGLVPRKSLDRNIQNIALAENNLSVCQNDLVYNMMRMWQGAIGIANTECMVSPAYIVLRPEEGINLNSRNL
jgi:type I restriction enzyme, S subunit